MEKSAATDYPIHELIATRWSPVGFAPQPVAEADLRSCLEAARWAASSYNEQPWSFLIARRQDEAAFAKMLQYLVEPNRVWAQNAGVLMLTCTNHLFARNGKPNTAALHDLGLAVANLTLEATARGLYVHQMKGILPEKAHQDYGVPDSVEVVTAVAIGTLADPETLPPELRQRDMAERTRKPQASFVFENTWGGSVQPDAGA